MRMYHRVQPCDAPAPELGSQVLTYERPEFWIAYVLGWYGDSCHAYEITGESLETWEEDVEIGTGIHLRVPVHRVEVATSRRCATVHLTMEDGTCYLTVTD